MSHRNILQDGTAIIEVPLDGSPEETAEALIKDSLPSIYLSDIDLGSPSGMLSLFTALASRHQEACVEYDELVGFVDRNRELLSDGAVLNALHDTAESEQRDSWSPWLIHLVEQMRLVLDGQLEQVELASDRLLWFCVALDYHLEGGKLSFDDARRLLREPTHRARMRPSALRNLFADYWQNMDTLESPRVYYVMLLAECALLAELADLGALAAVLLGYLPPPSDGGGAWLEQRKRLRDRLRPISRWSEAMEESLRHAESRFASHVDDDDL